MKEENIEEQSSSVETETKNADNSSTFENVETEQTATDAKKGEPIGRFNSAEELLLAYNRLEKEFTRKSQRLADLERENTPDEQSENALKAFLSKNSEAFSFADELKKRVGKEESQNEESYQKVWNQMLYEKLSGKDDFKQMILNDDDVKNLVIKNYVETLQKQQNPIVMSANSGTRVTKPVTPKPDSFEQAKKMVLDLLD